MSHTRVHYGDVDPVGGGLHFMRDALDCENLGFSVFECDPGWTGKAHDHAGDGQEEVYFLVDGAAALTVDGERVPLEPGDAVRVAPEATRQLGVEDEPSTILVVGAP